MDSIPQIQGYLKNPGGKGTFKVVAKIK